MPEIQAQIDIPHRALFKAQEVCELVKVQPYVLRSWEAEFQQLGVTKSAGGPRVYRREDVEQVVRIKHLLLVEGLTLAGARKRLEEEGTQMTADTDAPAIDALMGRNARERLTEVKRGLRSLLQLLSGTAGSREFQLSPPAVARVPRRSAATPKTARAKSAARSRPSARRKRSA